MPKRTGLTVVKNKDDEFVPTSIQSGWRVRTQPCYGSFQYYFGKAVAFDHLDARSSRLDTLWYFNHNVSLKYRIGTKLASLES